MVTTIGVKFRETGRTYTFDANDIPVRPGDYVVVETINGTDCARVTQWHTETDEAQLTTPLRKVLRRADETDMENFAAKNTREAEAFAICEKKIAEHKLEMKLVSAEYGTEKSNILFRFVSEGRVDFRALVRDLANALHVRIELRQIGVRDQAKYLGGLGLCGRPFCCAAFMDDFHPVSVKMAKEQNLSLNPAKISGTCGRLMCCLKYEEQAYADAGKKLPKVGSILETPDGKGVVIDVNAVSENVRVRLDGKENALPITFKYADGALVTKKAAILPSLPVRAEFSPSDGDEMIFPAEVPTAPVREKTAKVAKISKTHRTAAASPPSPAPEKKMPEKELPRYGKISVNKAQPTPQKNVPVAVEKKELPSVYGKHVRRVAPQDAVPAPVAAPTPVTIPEGPRRAVGARPQPGSGNFAPATTPRRPYRPKNPPPKPPKA